jgi:hypothetical protein
VSTETAFAAFLVVAFLGVAGLWAYGIRAEMKRMDSQREMFGAQVRLTRKIILLSLLGKSKDD